LQTAASDHLWRRFFHRHVSPHPRLILTLVRKA
jgi:hypothetical protein